MIRKLFSSQLRLNMASGVVMTIVSTVVTVVSFPIYLHFLGYEKYGVWLVLGTVLTFAQLGNLGIGQAVMKLVAEEYGRSNITRIQRYVTTALALLCLSGTIALIVILALKNQIIAAFKLSNENAKMVSWLLPYIGVLSIYTFIVDAFNATLSGLGRMDLANYIQSVGRILSVTVVTIFLYSGRGIESLLIGNTLLNVFIHGVSLIFIWRIAHVRFLQIRNLDTQCCKRLIRFGGAVFGGSLVSMLFSPFNKLMLSRYAGVSTIPVYEIAFNGSMQVRGLVEAGLRALMPEVSRISGDLKSYAKDRISHIYRRAMKLIFLFGVPMYVILVIFAPLLLKIWLREQFVESLPGAFQIMLVGTFLSLFGVPAYYTLMGTGNIRHNLGAHIVQAIINLVIVICVLITLTVSIDAIVWSSSIAMAGATLYLILQKRRTLQRVSNKSYHGRTNKEDIAAVPV